MKNLATAIATSGHLIEQNKQGLSVEDVFSTYLYKGTGAALDIVNGIDLATEGGLTWIKQRDATPSHHLSDTERGVTKAIFSDGTDAEITYYTGLTAFNTDGFTLGAATQVNALPQDYVSWTFRKAPRFFDVVTLTYANGSNTYSHNLGSAPGMVIIKRRDSSTGGSWWVYHRSVGSNDYLVLNTTASQASYSSWLSVTDIEFTLANAFLVDGGEYVAYLFAHDPLGPSGDGSDGLIACGSYDCNGGLVDLGWEPQFVLLKRTDYTGDWLIQDTMRGIVNGGNDSWLKANVSNAEVTSFDQTTIHPTGFSNTGGASGFDYIYMAIRRPMRTPESSDEVFAIDTRGSTVPTYQSGFPVDFALETDRDTTANKECSSRLTQGKRLATDGTGAEAGSTDLMFDYMDGWRVASTTDATKISWMWKRAKGFFDVVAYTGDGVAGRTVDHNLGVVPEMIWVKKRDGAEAWICYHSTLTATDAIHLNLDFAPTVSGSYWNNTEPTSSVFSLSTTTMSNGSGNDYITLLFATLAGISKVGSYTGNGSSQTLDCGFSAGAKFILIKRTDASGDWYFWDSVRGIVAGNDPHLSLNTTAAEVTSDDSIDPGSTGFIVNQVAATNINVSSATYIFYAIA